MKAVLMLPTYNEIENLEGLVREILSVDTGDKLLDILIIDDSSPDGTGEVADRLAAEFSRVKVIHRPPKSGRGSASLDGYKYATDNEYEYYLEMDVDHSHSPHDLPRLLAAADDADLVIASRFIDGGGVEGWNWKRHLLHQAADLAVKVVLGTPNTDHTNGYRCYAVETLRKINFSKMQNGGYIAHTLLENVYHRAGFKIKEVPSVFVNRTAGESKMGMGEAWEGMKAMLKMRWGLVRYGVGHYLY